MSLLLRFRRPTVLHFSLNKIITLFIIATTCNNSYTSTAFIMKSRSNKRLLSSSAQSTEKVIKISKIPKTDKSELPIENISLLTETLPPTQKVLLDLGDLIPMVVVQRPSELIKTPYIADLIFKPDDYSKLNFQLEVSNSESISNSASLETVSSTASCKGPSKKSIKEGQKAARVALSDALRATVSEDGIDYSLHFNFYSSLLLSFK